MFCLNADITMASSHGSKIVPVCIDDSQFIEQSLCKYRIHKIIINLEIMYLQIIIFDTNINIDSKALPVEK